MLMALQLEKTLSEAGLNPKEFTPGELGAIEGEASIRVAKGAGELSAVALAVHQCAPTKSRSGAFTGGNYLWSRNSDGTYNLFDVPVFATHVRKLGMKLVAGKDGSPKLEENVVNVNEAWLNKAIEHNRRRLDHDKYMGALHVRHHPQPGSGDQDKTEPAGHFILKYVRPTLFDGEVLPLLYADFVKIPAAVFERIRSGLLPYRSIESLPPKFEEIDSIALLDTETPWFRLPMLTPGEEIQREVYAATCSPLGSPLRGVAKTGVSQVAALCYFAGGSYSEKKEDSKADKEKHESGKSGEKDPESDGEIEAGEEGSGPSFCDACNLTHPNDGRHDEEDSEYSSEMQAEEGEGDDIMGKILDALTSLAKSVEALHQSVGVKPPPPAGKDGPVSEEGAKPSSIQSKASEGRLEAVEQVALSLKQERDMKALVAKAMTDLCEYNLGAVAGEKLLAKALASKEPEKCIADYVEAIKEHGTKMPSNYNAPRTSMTGKPFVPPPTAELPEAVREYSARGPEFLEKAIKAHELYLLCREQGSVSASMSVKDFIKHRVDPSYGASIRG
jgi:hypothetical protein